jgi:hypothetical protein
VKSTITEFELNAALSEDQAINLGERIKAFRMLSKSLLRNRFSKPGFEIAATAVTRGRPSAHILF